MKIFLDGHKPFEKHFKIKFDEPKIKIHSNGFISVTVDWHSKKDCEHFWRFKYPDLTHKMFGGETIFKRKKYLTKAAAFNFPDLDVDNEDCKKVDFKELKMASWFDICIGSETEEEFYKDRYDYIFFENTKYGLVCWFAPEGWEDWNSAKDFAQ